MSSPAAQPIKFVLVGAGGYGVNLGIFAALLRLGVAYVAASLAAYLCANAVMYVGNRYFTFRLGHDGFWRAYPRYLLVGAVVGGLNAGLLASLVEGTGVDPRVGQALSLLALTPPSFMLVRSWTFRLSHA